jgi:uncharacterized protein (DUF2267 family)
MWAQLKRMLALATVVAGIVWVGSSIGCQQGNQVTAPSTSELVPSIPDVAALPSGVTGGDDQQDFALHPPESDKRHAPIHIWRCLGLDSAQRIAVMACLQSYADGARAIIRALRESERSYVEQARQMRRAVLDSLRQRLIDRQTAAQRMREIAQWLREQLQNNPARQEAQQKLQELKQALCECVAAVLTPEQQQIWQCWCSGGTNCCPTGPDGGNGGDHHDGDHHGGGGGRGPRGNG